MIDQATELRKLVLRSMRERAAAAGPPPLLVLLAGGRGGVGVTTLSVNLAIGLADQGLRVVIVDADVRRNEVAVLCGIAERTQVLDVSMARRDIHEVLQRGPSGIQVVPGLWTPGEKPECGRPVLERLLRQFHALGPHAEVVLLDAGNGSAECARRFAAVANDVLIVTTPDAMAVMDSYARLKTAARSLGATTLRLVVNRCDDPEAAAQVHRRIDESCQRFLGIGIRLLGHVPNDEEAQRAAASRLPFLLSSPACPAGRAVQRLSLALTADWPDSSRHVA